MTTKALNKPMSVHFFATISKVDELTRTVGGVFTDTLEDSQGDIVEFAASKDAVEEYKQWRNIRAMHQPIAAGVASVIELNEATGEGYLEAIITDDNEWKKCLPAGEGLPPTYKGWSIGGRVIDSFTDAQGVRHITKYQLTEVSLVDRPANPRAVFTVVKVDGSEEIQDPSGADSHGDPDAQEADTDHDGEEGDENMADDRKDEETEVTETDDEETTDKAEETDGDDKEARKVSKFKKGDDDEGSLHAVIKSLHKLCKCEKCMKAADAFEGDGDSVDKADNPAEETPEDTAASAKPKADVEAGKTGETGPDTEGAPADQTPPDGPDPETVNPTTAAEKAAGGRLNLAKADLTTAFAKAIADAGLAKAADVQKVREELGKAVRDVHALKSEIEALKNAPADGGPVSRKPGAAPVEKGGSGQSQDERALEIATLEKAQDRASDPAVKDALGRQIAHLMHPARSR